MKMHLTIALLMYGTASFASPESTILEKAIPNLNAQMQAAQKKVDVPVVLPMSVPSQGHIQSIYFDATDRDNYHITLSDAKDCQGEKQCSVATITAEKGAFPSIFYDMGFDELTQRIQLTPDISGYYTPSFSVGSTSPSQISFRCEAVLYTVAWHVPLKENLKETLISLAKSMIAGQPTCDYHR